MIAGPSGVIGRNPVQLSALSMDIQYSGKNSTVHMVMSLPFLSGKDFIAGAVLPLFIKSNGNPVFTDPTIYGNSSNYHININYDNTYLASATDLSVAANAVHEMTHAYFINLYITGSMSANSANYNDLLNAFINFYDDDTA